MFPLAARCALFWLGILIGIAIIAVIDIAAALSMLLGVKLLRRGLHRTVKLLVIATILVTAILAVVPMMRSMRIVSGRLQRIGIGRERWRVMIRQIMRFRFDRSLLRCIAMQRMRGRIDVGVVLSRLLDRRRHRRAILQCAMFHPRRTLRRDVWSLLAHALRIRLRRRFGRLGSAGGMRGIGPAEIREGIRLSDQPCQFSQRIGVALAAGRVAFWVV